MEKLSNLIQGIIGREIISLETTNSTNTFALELGSRGAAHGTVVLAEFQTKGRGRLGRTWVSPRGNIYLSVLLRPAFPVRDATLLTIVGAVAGASGLRAATGLPVTIKWPNDLILSGKKLGGILSEIVSAGERILCAVIGIGINVNMGLDELPADIRKTATSLSAETGHNHPRVAITAAVLNDLDRWYNILAVHGRDSLLSEWRRLSSSLGRTVRVVAGNRELTGVAEDIDTEGRMLLRLSSGILEKVSAGDVEILK